LNSAPIESQCTTSY